jgi:predicted house-cleaning noncanonical NTP pyrophosphatase (MazG superfamily)
MSSQETREITVTTTLDIPNDIQIPKHGVLRRKGLHTEPALDFWRNHTQELGFNPDFDLTIDGDQETADITICWGDPSNPTGQFNTGNEYIDNADKGTEILGVIEPSNSAPSDEYIQMHNYQKHETDTIDEALTHCLGRALGVSFDSGLSIMQPRYAVFPSIANRVLESVDFSQLNLKTVVDALGPRPDETLEHGEYDKIIDNIDEAREAVLATQALYAERFGVVQRIGTTDALSDFGYFLLLFDKLEKILNYIADQAAEGNPVYDPAFTDLTPQESLKQIRETDIYRVFQRELYLAWVENQYTDNNSLHNKIVRDRIPEVIKDSGRYPITRRLTGERYRRGLATKLMEELNEYLAGYGNDENNYASELGDLLEVIHALREYEGMPEHELNELRANHAKELADENSRSELTEIMMEAYDEYVVDYDASELGNFLEVTHAFREHEGMLEHELNELRAEKAEERGRFENGVFLVTVIE